MGDDADTPGLIGNAGVQLGVFPFQQGGVVLIEQRRIVKALAVVGILERVASGADAGVVHDRGHALVTRQRDGEALAVGKTVKALRRFGRAEIIKGDECVYNYNKTEGEKIPCAVLIARFGDAVQGAAPQRRHSYKKQDEEQYRSDGEKPSDGIQNAVPPLR